MNCLKTFYRKLWRNITSNYWHNNDGRSAYTKKHVPYKLVYYEACVNEGDAKSRETYLKSGMGKRYLKNHLKRFLALTG